MQNRIKKFLNGTCGCFERGAPKKGAVDKPGIYFWNKKGQTAGKDLFYVGGTVRPVKTRIEEHRKAGKYDPEIHQVYSMPLKEGADPVSCVWPRELAKIFKYAPSTNKKKHIQRKK